MEILAFIESKKKTWTHTLSIQDSDHHEGKVLSINPPNIGYNLDEYFLPVFEGERPFYLDSGEQVICIDAMGRNYGVSESVYVNVGDLRLFLKQEGVID